VIIQRDQARGPSGTDSKKRGEEKNGQERKKRGKKKTRQQISNA